MQEVVLRASAEILRTSSRSYTEQKAGRTSIEMHPALLAMPKGLHGKVAADEAGHGLLVIHSGDGAGKLVGHGDGLDLAANLDGDGVGDHALHDGGVV